jgi:hypothetical protein
VNREPDREVEHDPDHRGGDRGERPRERLVAAHHLDERRAEEDPQEHGMNVTQVARFCDRDGREAE